jgi:hypothetical protein
LDSAHLAYLPYVDVMFVDGQSADLLDKVAREEPWLDSSGMRRKDARFSESLQRVVCGPLIAGEQRHRILPTASGRHIGDRAAIPAVVGGRKHPNAVIASTRAGRDSL